ALGDRRVAGQYLFHFAGGQPVARHVDHVVDAAHDVQVTVLVPETAVAGQVVAGVPGQVRPDETVVVVPERRQAARRERQLDRDVPRLVRLGLLALLVQDLNVVAGDGQARRTWLGRFRVKAHRVGDDRPAGLGLPPVV